jgi:hypothetical protein
MHAGREKPFRQKEAGYRLISSTAITHKEAKV